jgi:Icc-related predicted phosphoesterase
MSRVLVVSDVHGRADALRDIDLEAADAQALICLGDLVLFLDYRDYSAGIMGQLFGAEAVGQFVRLRTERRFEEARVWSRGLWESLEGPREDVIVGAVHAQYAELFAAFADPTFLTYGNVDLPRLYPDHLRETTTLLDGQVVEIEGVTFGFVGGGLPTPMRTPMEVPLEEYDEKVRAIEGADVLCSHIPPHLPELTYDTVSGRYERGSTALLDAIRRTKPKVVLHGHVHQPLQPELTIGGTRVVNVGHFRATRTPFTLEF